MSSEPSARAIEDKTLSAQRRRISVTKIDAARQQLDCAIELWFREKDPVSIHTLAAAAYEIVHAIHRKNGKEDLLYDTDFIKEEYQKKFASLLRKPANFFKHADTDPDPLGTFEFVPFLTEAFMMFTIMGLRNIGQPDTPMTIILITWMAIRDVQWAPVGLRQRIQSALPAHDFSQLENANRSDFFEMCLKTTAAVKERLASELKSEL